MSGLTPRGGRDVRAGIVGTGAIDQGRDKSARLQQTK
jgi:hypothetical protein